MRKPANYYIKKENRLKELDEYIKKHNTIDGITTNKVGRRIYDIFLKYHHPIEEAVEELGYDINKIKKIAPYGSRKNKNCKIFVNEKEIKQFINKYDRLPPIGENIKGIYIITNKVNNKVYIGQSVNIKERWEKHLALLRNNCHFNQHLQNAWNKFGEENFKFDILEIVKNESDLTSREQYYIDFVYQSRKRENGYNIRPANEGGHLPEEIKKKIRDANKGKKRSEETRRKMSNTRKGKKRKPLSEETKKKISMAHKGKKIPEEVRRKISNTLTGRKTKPCSEETKRKISEAQKGKPRKKHSEETKIKMGNSRRKINNSMAKCIFEKFNLLLKDMRKMYIYELLSNEYGVGLRTIRTVIKKVKDGDLS